MFDLPIDSLFNPVLLFWISFFYLVILFHSYGIAKIWNRINGVELLFLSAVVGYIFYIATIYLIFPLIGLINGLIGLFPKTIIASLSLFQINYTDLGQLFVYLFVTILVPLFSYFIIISSIYLVIKLIQYCLDPNNVIFPNYRRFVVLKKIKLSNTIVLDIPYFFFLISVICLLLGGLINTTQNILFSWDIWSQINNFLQGVVFIGCVVGCFLFLMDVKKYGLNICKFAFYVYNNVFEHMYRNQNVKPEETDSYKLTKLGIFIQNHLGALIIFCIFWMLLLALTQYHQGTISFIELLVWIILFIVSVIIASLPPEWIKKLNRKIQCASTNLSIPSNPPKNSTEQKIDFGMIDAPLDDPDDDQFLRENFTEGITNLIKNRNDPSSLVIGIYGEWGEGKSSVLNFIKKDLEKNPDVVCVKFNPWRYNDEMQLLRNFFFTLADALETSLSTSSEKIGEFIGKYATILSPVTLKIGDIAEVSPGGVLTNAGKIFSSVELEDLKERIEKILDVEQKKVVIFIDDIDRLDRQEIQILLKIVKLSADFRHTFYILAFDEEMVASALSEKYGSGAYTTENNENGKRFLEKIIQIPLPLPKINDNVLLSMCFKGIENLLKNEKIQLSDEELQQFVYQFNLGFITHLKTPRLVKRYLNTLSFSLPLLKNAISIPDLLLIEAIHVFRPSCFLKIREYPEVFLGSEFNTLSNPEEVKKRYLSIWDSVFKEEIEFEKGNLKKVLSHIFPRTRTLYENMNYGRDWDLSWDKEKKLASKRHLDRYFAYAFPKGDVSEIEIKQVIAIFGKLDEPQKFEILQKFTADVQSADLFILELRKNIGDLNPDYISDFILSLSKNSFLFPKIDIGFKLSPYSQLAAFLHERIDAIPETSQKMSLLKSICSSAEPPSFGFNILRNVEQKIKAEPNPNMSGLQEVDLNALSNIILERVQTISLDSLISSNDMPITFYYWSKYGSKKDIESYLSESFVSKPDSVIRFLKCYVSKAFNADGPVRGSLMRDPYNAIAKFCDPSIIYTALERLFGDLSNAEYREDDDIIDEERQIAIQFSYMYHHKEQKTDELIPTESNQTSNEKAEKDN